MTRKNPWLPFLGLSVVLVFITGSTLADQRFTNVRPENGELLWLSAALVDVITPSAQTVNVTIFDCTNQVLVSANVNVPAGVPGRTVVSFLGPIPNLLLPPQPLRWRFLVGTIERGEQAVTITNGRFPGDCTSAPTSLETSKALENLAIQYWVVNPQGSDSISTPGRFIGNARAEEGNYIWYGATIADRLTAEAFNLRVQIDNCAGETISVLTGLIPAGDAPLVAFLIGLVDGGQFMPLVWQWSADGDSETAITDADGVSEGTCP